MTINIDDLLGPVRPTSVIFERDPFILNLMLNFYAGNNSRILDVTSNQRRMWSGVTGHQVTYLDIDFSVAPTVVGDFKNLPFRDSSFDVVVFDPPHLPAAAASPFSDMAFGRRYGLKSSPSGDGIEVQFKPFLAEAERVLRRDGLIFAKLKDFVHNHRYQWTLVEWVQAVRNQPGLTPCDLIIKKDPSGGSLKSSKWVNTHHVRNSHCWWAVVRKGKCEAK